MATDCSFCPASLSLSERVLEALHSLPEPDVQALVSALFPGAAIEACTKEVNSALYALEKRGLVERKMRTGSKRPVWCLPRERTAVDELQTLATEYAGIFEPREALFEHVDGRWTCRIPYTL